ncbi:MAG: sortase [Actinomycetota bacterium]|nr:sortase [Actinomycetota bacterium]
MEIASSVFSKRLEKLSRKSRKRLSNLLIISGIIVIVFPLATEAYGYYKSVRLMKAWEKQAKSQTAEAIKVRNNQDRMVAAGQLPDEEAILGGAAPDNSNKTKSPFPKTKIFIPKIGVNQVVLEGSSPDVLKNGPGHYTGMANPGAKGNCGIAGHRVTYTHPFNRLDELSQGDVIILETVDYRYEYRVETVAVVDPKNVSTLRPTSDAKVTLTTCNPKYSAKTRLNVQGVLVDTKPLKTSIIRVVKRIFKEPQKKKKPVDNKPKTYAELVADLKTARKAAVEDPANIDSHVSRAQASLALSLYDEMLEAIRAAEFINPKSADIIAVKEGFAAKTKQLQDKVDARLKEVGAGGTMDPMVFLELGDIYMATGDYESAAKVYDQLVKMMPHTVEAYYYKATALERMGQDMLAIENYREALVYDPGYQEALQAIERINKGGEGDSTAGASDAGKEPVVKPDSIQSHPYRLRPQ